MRRGRYAKKGFKKSSKRSYGRRKKGTTLKKYGSSRGGIRL